MPVPVRRTDKRQRSGKCLPVHRAKIYRRWYFPSGLFHVFRRNASGLLWGIRRQRNAGRFKRMCIPPDGDRRRAVWCETSDEKRRRILGLHRLDGRTEQTDCNAGRLHLLCKKSTEDRRDPWRYSKSRRTCKRSRRKDCSSQKISSGWENRPVRKWRGKTDQLRKPGMANPCRCSQHRRRQCNAR